jgi:tripartite-type tricarboxylate transporter receptor subunit TctC
MKRALLLVLALAASPAPAQSWPVKPIRAVVPVGAGSSTDIVHRLVLEQLAAQLGQPIIVENRVGAGGTLGSAAVAKAQPDGYTLLGIGSSHTIVPALYKGLPYDPVRDFAAVAMLGSSPSVLVVAPGRGVKSAAELVAAAKAKPNGLNFSSASTSPRSASALRRTSARSASRRAPACRRCTCRSRAERRR